MSEPIDAITAHVFVFFCEKKTATRVDLENQKAVFERQGGRQGGCPRLFLLCWSVTAQITFVLVVEKGALKMTTSEQAKGAAKGGASSSSVQCVQLFFLYEISWYAFVSPSSPPEILCVVVL